MAQKHFVIVYQFGKVASTALVKTLNTHPEIDAHQSHFLGEDALKRMVVNATGPTHSAYFRKHMVGQLNANLDLTYQMNRARLGHDGRRLTILSLSRAPLDWFRSSIQQDIEGHLPDLLALGQGANQADRLRDGLDQMLDRVAALLATHGGVATIASDLIASGARPLLTQLKGEPDFIKTMLLQALRPVVWFEDHFARCFDLSLDDIHREDGFWLRKTRQTTFILLRYEDIAQTFASAMVAANLPATGPMIRANDSRAKPFAQIIKAAFDTEHAHQLGALLAQSDYARHFGYTKAPAQNAKTTGASKSNREMVVPPHGLEPRTY